MLNLALTTAGIYRIVNERTETIYVGSAVDVQARIRSHRGMLRRGVHDNIHLQRSWDKDGASAFAFERLTTCDVDDLTAKEQWWVDFYRDNGTPLYNLRPVVESQLGLKHSAESRAKMSAAKRRLSSETRAKMSEAARRYRELHPEEFAGRGFQKGQPSWNKGKPFSAESRARMSEAQSRRKPRSEETRRKLSLAGTNPSEETRARRSVSIRAAWAKKSTEERAAIKQKAWATRRAEAC